MFLLTERDKKDEGAYAVKDRRGNKVLFMFEEEDDALRYAQLLELDHGVEMSTIEIDEDIAIKACEMYNYKYSVITPDDIVIPPSKDDNISED
jgi:hypothetical protein|tara:strand:+ start:939 stop:1217 length:279 start_codon:yes stop_codon:yes gene_type:complete